MFWDTHTHSHFSGDSQADPGAMAKAARDAGLSGICFTEHLDWDYKKDPELFLLDLPGYLTCMEELARDCPDGFSICAGIELGLQPHLASRHQALLSEHIFDFVLGSSHVVEGIDPYYPEFYEGRSEDEAYAQYFSSILENILAFDGFDVYGHLDYVVRYGPNRNKFYSYEKFRDILDEILKELIARGKGIELNTGGFKYGLGHPNPTEAVLKRYRELGGELITVGSDAHKPEHVAYDFDRAAGILRDAGFRYFTVYKKRKPEFLRLP